MGTLQDKITSLLIEESGDDISKQERVIFVTEYSDAELLSEKIMAVINEYIHE